MPRLHFGVATLKGGGHPRNEDRFCTGSVVGVGDECCGETFYGAVFDGHGGSGCSDFLKRSLPHKMKLYDWSDVDGWSRNLEEIHEQLEREFISRAKNVCDSSGACSAICVTRERQVCVAWVGDCRVVCSPDKRFAKAWTRDHRASVQSERRRILRAGGHIVDGRVMGCLMPSRSFGDIDVKLNANEGVVIAIPDTTSFSIDYTRGKRPFILIASDGVWDAFSSQQAVIRARTSISKRNCINSACQHLCQNAVKVSSDDCTVIMMYWS